MKRIMVLVVVFFLVYAPALLAQEVSTISLGGKRLDGAFGEPDVVWREALEGRNADPGLMTQISSTTVIIVSPGSNSTWGDSDDGIIHCFALGSATQACQFITTGGLDHRNAIRVNDNVAVVPSTGTGAGGSQNTYCEDNAGTADDRLLILRGLGATGATFESAPGGPYCFGTPAADPIRINSSTVITAQPGANTRFHDSGNCTATKDDTVVVVRGLSRTGTAAASTLTVGTTLSVHLTGAPGGRPVRVSDTTAVILSPAADGEFASSNTDCGDANTTAANDGLVIIRGLSTTAPALQPFFVVGRLVPNESGRPVAVGSSVVLVGTGADKDYDPDAGDNTIHVVRGVVTGTTAKTDFTGTAAAPIASMHRPQALNASTALFFDVNEDISDDDARLFVHIVSGIGGTSPTRRTVRVPGSTYGHSSWSTGNAGVVMNSSQVLFHVYGQNQVLSLTNGRRIKLGASGGANDDWVAVRLTKVNSKTVAYVAAKEGALGFLKIGFGGALTDTRLTLGGKTGPAGQPVAVGSSHAAWAIFSSGAILVGDPDEGVFEFFQVKTGVGDEDQLCAAPACRPISVGSGFNPALVIAAPGADGNLTTSDDEIIVVTDLF